MSRGRGIGVLAGFERGRFVRRRCFLLNGLGGLRGEAGNRLGGGGGRGGGFKCG